MGPALAAELAVRLLGAPLEPARLRLAQAPGVRPNRGGCVLQAPISGLICLSVPCCCMPARPAVIPLQLLHVPRAAGCGLVPAEVFALVSTPLSVLVHP